MVFVLSAQAGLVAEKNKNKTSGRSQKPFQLTWIDFAFANFYSVPNTRLADFSDLNLGGAVRVHFMILEFAPLWISTQFMVNAHLTNSHRLDRITDLSAGIGVGWRFKLPKHFSITPRFFYGYMLHIGYGDYYNAPNIYPGDPRAGTKDHHFFSDQFFQYEVEVAYDLSHTSEGLDYEVFLSPTFIHFAEKHRQGLEMGYLLGIRIRPSSIRKKKDEPAEDSPWGFYGRIYDKDTNEPLNRVKVTVMDRQGNEFSSKTDRKGEFKMPIEGESEYELLFKKSGYFTIRANFSTVGKSPGWYNIQDFMKTAFQKSEVGATLEFANIYYDSGSWELRKDSIPGLDRIVIFLKDNPEIDVELGAHTDSMGDGDNNMVLSQKRAQSAVDYLVEKGISKDRITAKGYGETRIKNHCKDNVRCSIREHQVNRRTELLVTRIVRGRR